VKHLRTFESVFDSLPFEETLASRIRSKLEQRQEESSLADAGLSIDNFKIKGDNSTQAEVIVKTEAFPVQYDTWSMLITTVYQLQQRERDSAFDLQITQAVRYQNEDQHFRDRLVQHSDLLADLDELFDWMLDTDMYTDLHFGAADKIKQYLQDSN